MRLARRLFLWSLPVTLFVFLACGGDSPASTGSTGPASCVPNRTEACTCAGGQQGVQVCEPDGLSYSPCECGDSGTAPPDVVDGSASGPDADVAAPAPDAGVGQVATLGSACSSPGALACAGNHQKVTAICSTDGTWEVNMTCGLDEYCDSTPGPSAGLCRPVVDRCKGRQPDDTYCTEPSSTSGPANVYECGPDTVTSIFVKDCRAGAPTTNPPSCDYFTGVCTICTNGDVRCNGKQRQVCTTIGGYSWKNNGPPCANSCSMGTCI
jgi:hypothetical protein